MPDWHDVKIYSPQEIWRGKDAFIELDGRKMKGVTKVTTIVAVNDANRVIVEFFAKSVDITTEVESIEEPAE